MANIQESILQAVDTLVENRVNGIEADKTVIATIVTCSNAFTREYKVSYNGGNMTAYAQDGVTYSSNTSVYVLVPQGDFTQKKTIIGKTQSISDDENISFVSSALSDYNMIGSNCASNKKNITPKGLNSYYKNDYALLYKYGDIENKDQFLSIDTDSLNNNLREAEAIMIEASFRTELPKAHRLNSVGLYGLQFVLAFQDTSKDLVSLFDYEARKQECITDNDFKAAELIENNKNLLIAMFANDAFTSADKIDYLNYLKSYKNIVNSINIGNKEQTKLLLCKTQLLATIQAVYEMLDAANSLNAIGYDCFDKICEYIYLPQYHTYDTSSIPLGTEYPKKYLSYALDSNQMTGNPLNFNVYSDQYNIFTIDTENFLYIDSILFYSQDFVDKDDKINAVMYGNDIFVDQIEFYGLRKISAKNGEYVLSLSMPQGSTFKSILQSDTLQVLGKVTQNINTNLSDATTFYWLKEDGKITADKAFAYAGKGWRLLEDQGHNYTFQIPASENLAYENKYLCVAIYHDELILKEQFILYNNSVKRDLSITSSLGTKFSFDRGKPTLTCLIDGLSENFEAYKVNGHTDDKFTFVWSKIDSDGNVTIFNQTKQELEDRYKANLGKVSYSELSSLKNQILQLDGVEWDKNTLTYPVKQIDSTATFKCSVYLYDDNPENDYLIGAPEIVLMNETAEVTSDYSIEIVNGDQVFQYSESGVTPTSDRNDNPQEVLPLSCKFYDPNGLEVSSSAYEVKWKVPLTNSMIVAPTKNMSKNPANDKIEWCMSQNYPLAIADNYNYNDVNNQIQCIVTYGDLTYTRDTNLLFTKVGENGTNGTDIVARIKVNQGKLQDNVLPALVIQNTKTPTYKFNNGQDLSQQVFNFQLYQRNEKLTANSVYWNMAGGQVNHYSISNGVLSYATGNTGKFNTQIVKASTTWENTQYYAYYGFPVIKYNYFNYSDTEEYSLCDFDIQIDDVNTLKSINYNANGYNPLFNKNQGACIHIMDGQVEINNWGYIVWSAEGGEPTKVGTTYSENPYNAAFTLSREKNSKNGSTVITPKDTADYLNQVYIIPNDNYTGEYVNNCVHARIYKSKEAYEHNGTVAVEVYIPIIMTLNTNELKSLNAWDGTHLEINEDENYILAPQIGAGEKDKNNKFTGIVMGKANYYDRTKDTNDGTLEASSSLGLLGYSHGLQSIFLDAETGNATFGLPNYNSSSQSNQLQEGLIKFVPNGTSSIGNWKIGRYTLYQVDKATLDSDVNNPVYLDSAYSDMDSKRYQSSIPHTSEGVLLSANPAYISIKGRPLEATDADYTAANTIVQPKDSFELQLDPNYRSVFTVYRHTSAPQNDLFTVFDGYIWKSSDLVVKSDGSGYQIADGKEKSYYSAAKWNADGTEIIGWTLVNKYKNNYLIARQKTDSNQQIVPDDWYFCQVKGNQDNVYWLPEYTTNSDLKTQYESQILNNSVWHREAKVGINSQGRFYTNALKDNTTALNIGPLGAFGHSALENAYVGAAFEIGSGDTSNSLLKIFSTTDKINSKQGTLYLSGATDTANEYQREMRLYGNGLGLYSNTKGTSTDSIYKLELNEEQIGFGYFATNVDNECKFVMPFGKSKDKFTQLKVANDFALDTPKDRGIEVNTGDMSISLGKNQTSHGKFQLTSSQTGDISFGKDLNVVSSKNIGLQTQSFKTEFTNNNIEITSVATRNDEAKTPILNLKLSGNISQQSYLNFDSGLNVTTYKSPIKIKSDGSANGIQLEASPAIGSSESGVSLKMIPQSGGTHSTFYLASPSGSVYSKYDALKSDSGQTYSAVCLQSGFLTNYGVIDSVLPYYGSTTSLETARDIRIKDGWLYTDAIYFHSGDALKWESDDNYYWSLDTFRRAWNTTAAWGDQNAKNELLHQLNTSIQQAYERGSQGITAAGNAEANAKQYAKDLSDTKISIDDFNTKVDLLRNKHNLMAQRAASAGSCTSWEQLRSVVESMATQTAVSW